MVNRVELSSLMSLRPVIMFPNFGQQFKILVLLVCRRGKWLLGGP